MNIFANMKVTNKLLLLLVVMSIGFVATGVTYTAVLKAEDATLASNQQTTQFQLQIKGVEYDIAEAVTDQRDFLLTRRLEDLDDFENRVSKVRDVLGQLEIQAPSARLKQLITPVNDVLTAFHTSVFQLAATQLSVGLTQETGLQGDMRTAGNELETALDKAIESFRDRTFNTQRRSATASADQLTTQKLLTSMLTMRRHERDYLQDKDEININRMADERDNFLKLLEQSSFPDKTKASLGGLLADYQHSFDEMVKATVKLQQGYVAVNTTFAAITPALAAMTEATEVVAASNLVTLEARRNRLSTVFYSVLAITAVAVALIVFFFSRGITNPLQRLQATVQQVTEGDMAARARLEHSDEIGLLANAFDNLLDERMAQLDQTERERAARLAEAERENEALNTSVVALLQAVARLSQRDLTIRVPVAEDVTGPVSDALNLLADETAKVLTEVTRISDDVDAVSRGVKSQSDTVVALASKEREQVMQTSKELAMAAEAMNEIASLAQTCNTAAENAIQNTQAALETVTGTVHGINATRDTIRETEKRIKRLGERSQEISGAVNLINNIAERTHILALNASMHAASAGEAGRGFAVVADEVQRLAENARQATEQIAGLVSNIQTETMDTVTTMNTVITQVVEGSRLAEQAGEQMRETQQATSELVDSVRQIAMGSQTQAKISNELSNRAGQIVESTIQTSQQLEEQGVQTNQLQDYASRLVRAVRVFTLPGQQSKTDSESELSAASGAGVEQEDWQVVIKA
jgi:methyl-accepting chemotaxis protein